MKWHRRLSRKQFEKRHPGVELVLCFDHRARKELALVWRGQSNIAAGSGRTQEEAIYDVSARLLKLAGLEAMDRQNWQDASTGQTGVPLQSHHVVKRSKRRLDSTENLAGVSVETHAHQHEAKGKL